MSTKKELATHDHRDAAVARAKEMLNRANRVNKAQFAHGINSTSATIEWWVNKIETGTHGTYFELQILHDKVMKLGGYLYSLKEGIA